MQPENSEIKSKLLLYFPFINTYQKKFSLVYIAHQSKMNKLPSDKKTKYIANFFLQQELFITKFKTDQNTKWYFQIFLLI